MYLTHERDVPATQLIGRSTHLLIDARSGSTHLTHNVSYFAPGHAPGHVHDPEEEVFYVDAGSGEVWIDGIPYALQPGTTVHTPQRVEHNVHVASSVPMRIIGSFSPHVVPGSYPNLPPRSRDLPYPPNERSDRVIAVADDHDGPVITTDRVHLERRRTEGATSIAADGHDLVVHVLRGTGRIETPTTTATLGPGSVVLLTAAEQATIQPAGTMAWLAVRSIAPLPDGPRLSRTPRPHV